MTNRIADENARCSAASFRICGEALNLQEIETMLAIKASQSHLKGEKGEPSRFNVVFRESLWSLKSPLDKSESLDKHLEWLLDRLEPKTAEVQHLARLHRLDFFCGFASPNGQGGFILDGALLARLAKLGVPVGLDLYPPPPLGEDEQAAPLSSH